MIEKLHRIVLQVAEATDLPNALRIMVQGICEAMRVDACAVYLVDPIDDHIVLMESDGYNRDAIGRVRLAPGEGVVSLVREHRGLIALDSISEHPRYRYFPETGEARYKAFLGVPVMHYRNVIGILTVLQKGKRTFSNSQKAFLITASAQLSGTLAEAINLPGTEFNPQHSEQKSFYKGVSGAPGVAIGTVVMPSALSDLDAVPDRPVLDRVIEETAFCDAVISVKENLLASGEHMKDLLPSEAHALFEVYALLVGDDSLISRVIERIRQGQWAPAALRDVIQELCAKFEDFDDERLRERAEDIRAVGRRLLLELHPNNQMGYEFPERSILIGDEVSLARIANVPRGRLAGIVCTKGSILSHTAVVARALAIPAVMGVRDFHALQLEGHTIIVDGYRGQVIIDPAQAVLDEFHRIEQDDQVFASELEALRELPSETTDGVRLPLHVNTGLLTDLETKRKVGAEGIGLYRSEFSYMLRDSFPSEDEQYTTYLQVLEDFAPRPVTMRTLDIGGDKPLPYFPIDATNSLLGWRGIRVTLDHPEIFLTQLRAMLRANASIGNLRLLLPMVSIPGEILETRTLINTAINDLGADGITVEVPPLGVMIEVPVALYEIHELAKHADFFSLGTNDLTQYLMAVDRSNPRVAPLYDHLHPAALRAIHHAVTQVHALGKSISVCGELAGDPTGAILLMAMGVDYLSMAASALPKVKLVIRSVSRQLAVDLLEVATRLPDADAVRQHVRHVIGEAGLVKLSHVLF